MVKAKQGGSFKPVRLPKPQTTVARCISVIHIGTVANIFNGKLNTEKPKTEKLWVQWEFPKLMEIFSEEKGEQPWTLGLELTLSTNENSNLAKLVSNWRNNPLSAIEEKSFDPMIMLGRTCMISFVHNTKLKYRGQDLTEITNENSSLKFNGIMPLPEELTCPAQINPEITWDWEPYTDGGKEFDQDEYQKMYPWMQKKVAESDEFKKYGDPNLFDEDADQSSEASPEPKAEKEEPIDKGGAGW